MNAFTKILALVVMMIASGVAQAATYYETPDNCEAAWRAGKAVDYKPTGQHTKFSDDRIKGLEARPLEGDACVYLGAQPGKRWVFMKQGTLVYTQGAVIKFLKECQNDIYEVRFLKKEEKTAAPATPAPCEGDACNKVVVQTITQVTRLIRLCEDGGRRWDAVNGRCDFAPTTANIGVKIETKIDGGCPGNCQTPAPVTVPPQRQSQNLCQGTGCVPQEVVKITGRVERTDGRCVLSFDDFGTHRFVRFETKKGTNLLVAAQVANEKGDWVETNPLSLVGDGKMTVQLDGRKSCKAAVEAFTSTRSFEWSASRIGLPLHCKPIGQVTTLEQQPANYSVPSYSTPRAQAPVTAYDPG